MAGQALREHLKQFFGMRFRWRVAVGAFWNQAVPGVAKGTADRAVLAGRVAPFCVDVAVTGIAGFYINRFTQTDLERLVNIMALGAGRHRLGREVWLVAFGAGRYIAVTIMMATAALLLGVLTWLRFQLLGLFAVTVSADPRQHVGHRHPTRCVGVFVAVQTLNMLISMPIIMTSHAFRHDVRVIFLQRIVGMTDLRAFATINTMHSARFFEVPEMGRMALTALGDLQWLWGDLVE